MDIKKINDMLIRSYYFVPLRDLVMMIERGYPFSKDEWFRRWEAEYPKMGKFE